VRAPLHALRYPALILLASAGATWASAAPAATPASAAGEARACEKLSGAAIPGGRIRRAALVTPPFVASWEGNSVKENVAVPFCRLEGEAASTPGSDIRFEVWLPTGRHWNGRLLGVGAGNSLGAINRPDLALGVNRGFAAVATDNGHHGYKATDSAWALGHPERIEDFGYRAHHLATQAAKQLVQRFYGKPQRFAYYFGCSQGGVKGLMAAQRFPNDYNGILAGAPVYSWPAEMTLEAWNYRALTDHPGAAISEPQMLALYAASVKQCGGPDGLIGDPRLCQFDPAVLQCPADENCLSPVQVEAVRKMYAGPHTSSGMPLNHGLTPGSESRWEGLWDLVQPDPTRSGSWLGVYRYMVFEDPQWNPVSLNFDTDPASARRKLGPILDPDSPDLSEFRKRGGKLLVYHGWADQMVPAESSTDYYAAVVARLGQKSVDQFFRLFMLPGMAHCAGGPGAAEILRSTQTRSVPLQPDHDVLVALVHWVEHGDAPARLIAIKTDDAEHLLRTRLVCAEPQVTRYRGSGDPLDAASWECVAR